MTQALAEWTPTHLLVKELCRRIAQRALAHVYQADVPLAAAVGKQAAVRRMELHARDDLRKVLHV